MPIQQMFLGAGGEVYAGDSQQQYTSAGTYSWVAPFGVEKISIVLIGAGGGASDTTGSGVGYGGGGGACTYKNNISVTAGAVSAIEAAGGSVEDKE